MVQDEKLAGVLGLTLEVPTDPDVIEQFGSKPMSALWPGRKSLPLMAEAKQSDPKIFTALYMGRPSPDEGDYFVKDWLVEYDRDELPRNMKVYGASDHAVSKKQRADSSVIGCVGIDENDHIWVLPDLVWGRMKTDRMVEELLTQFKLNKPGLWWLEDELISKSFGPFLMKRMQEEKIYTTLDPITPAQDLEVRGRAIQGRASMKMIHFPKFAPWWQMARGQLLMFPSATHDDFVAWLALVGLGLTKHMRPGAKKPAKDDTIRSGSLAWILRETEKRIARKKADDARAGW